MEAPLPALILALKNGGARLDNLQVNVGYLIGRGRHSTSVNITVVFVYHFTVLRVIPCCSLCKIKGGNTRRTEDTGEWDGVDLASAPCLQPHIVRARNPSPYLEVAKETQERECNRPATARSVRPSTPPALLVYKPCLRWVKRRLQCSVLSVIFRYSSEQADTLSGNRRKRRHARFLTPQSPVPVVVL